MLYEPSIIIHVEDFLFHPFIAEGGETRVEQLYCVHCWLDLEEMVELIELWRSPELGIAYCPLCNQETSIRCTFKELQNEVKQKLVNEEWRIIRYGRYKILKVLKRATHKRAEAN